MSHVKNMQTQTILVFIKIKNLKFITFQYCTSVIFVYNGGRGYLVRFKLIRHYV